jgi:hypothetical protein
MHRIPVHRQLQADREGALVDAVVVEQVLRAVCAVWDVGDVGPHLLLGAIDHLPEALRDGLDAVALHQPVEPAPADREHVRHGHHVADDLVRQADIRAEHLHQSLVQPAALDEFHRRYYYAFLVDLRRLRRPAAGHAAADVHPVARVGHQREQPPVDEMRGDHLHVLEVAAAEIRVVDDPDVAFVEAALRLGDLDEVLDRELHVGEEDRQAVAALGDRFAGDWMKDAVGAVVRLGDDRRERGVDEMEVHLVADLLEAALDHGESDRIHHLAPTIMLARASIFTLMPGSIKVVVSSCSTTAGPSNVWPGLRSSR